MNPGRIIPDTDWMQNIASYLQWVRWWGGEQVYQQSPLFAYWLAVALQALSKNLVYVRIEAGDDGGGPLRAIGAAGPAAGGTAGWLDWIYFGGALRAFYRLFIGKSCGTLLEWFLTTALLVALTELSGRLQIGKESRWLSVGTGVLLGLGLLAEETYAC